MAPTLKYPAKQMEDAIRECRNGLAIRAAVRKYGVPRATLQDKLSGRTPEGRCRRSPSLGMETEKKIVNWIKKQESTGLPPKMDNILNFVQQLVKEDNLSTPFRNGRPGVTWFKFFQKRNPLLASKSPERVPKARAKVQESTIRKWFENLRQYIQEQNVMDIFEDPTRIFNTGETTIQLLPNTRKIMSFNDWKNVYELAPGLEKSTLTFLGTFSASGDILLPMLIYPYCRIPKDIVNSVPKDWYIGSSETGQMKTEIFYEFIANAFIPWLNSKNIVKPVILFVDGYKTHTSFRVTTLCEENGIILYLLPPNTMHILQPADVGPFHLLKAYWWQVVHKYHQENPNQVVTRKDVAPLLKNALELIQKSSIVNGFSATGLFPLDPDKPDYSKIIEIELEDNEENKSKNEEERNSNVFKLLREEEFKIAHKVLMELMDDESLQKFQTNQHPEKKFQDVWNILTRKNRDENCDIKNEIEIMDALSEDLNVGAEAPHISTPAKYIEYLSSITRGSSEDRVIPAETATAFVKQQFYKDDIKLKKKKAPNEKLSPCTKSENCQRYYEDLDVKKLQMKSKYSKRHDDEWKCNYCNASWYQDRKEKTYIKWVECNKYRKISHTKCISKKHAVNFNLSDSSDNEIDFEKFIPLTTTFRSSVPYCKVSSDFNK